MLAPVVNVSSPGQPWRTALFTISLLPARVQAMPTTAEDGEGAWHIGHVVRLEPGQRRSVRGYLCVHGGDAYTAWAAFRRFGHHEDFPPVPWLHNVRVHYFDFLSAVDPKGRRGDGYDADLPLFGRFHVGLATQHGYYPFYGDYLHPDRKQWRAMISDPAGPVTMSLAKIKARVQATRLAGTIQPCICTRQLFDEASPLYERLKDSIVVSSAGRRTDFGWQGPDTSRRSMEDVGRFARLARPFAPTGPMDHGAARSGRNRDGRNLRGSRLRPSSASPGAAPGRMESNGCGKCGPWCVLRAAQGIFDERLRSRTW